MQGPSLSREGDRSITVQEERVTKGETGGYRHVIKKRPPGCPDQNGGRVPSVSRTKMCRTAGNDLYIRSTERAEVDRN